MITHALQQIQGCGRQARHTSHTRDQGPGSSRRRGARRGSGGRRAREPGLAWTAGPGHGGG